jgi:hypothetical protein
MDDLPPLPKAPILVFDGTSLGMPVVQMARKQGAPGYQHRDNRGSDRNLDRPELERAKGPTCWGTQAGDAPETIESRPGIFRERDAGNGAWRVHREA